MIVLLALVVFGFLGGAICGYVALVKIASLRREIEMLKQARTPERASRPRPVSMASPVQRPVAEKAEEPRTDRDDKHIPEAAASASHPVQKSPVAAAIDHLRGNWMMWLGGGCVTLAAIFFISYSIEQGLIGPVARIVLALLFGGACHALAEFMRRRDGQTYPALGALAGAGSITLYAALLAAFRMYDLISPGTAFLFMAIVAVGTMVMARLHGPLLAAFGIIGAYLVPILLSTGGGDIRIAMLYALIVSGSALLLMRYVYRPWLWWGFAAGALGWWAISLTEFRADGIRTLYLAALGYMVYALPHFDWKLRRETLVPGISYDPRALFRLPDASDRHRVVLAMLMAVGVFITVLGNPDTAAPWTLVTPFLFLALLLARHQDALYWLPWTAFAGGCAGWLLTRLDPSAGTPLITVLDAEDQRGFLGYLAVQAAMMVPLALWLFASTRRPAVWASLATIAPVFLLTLAYLLMREPLSNGQWAFASAALAISYLGLAGTAARRVSADSLMVWLIAAGHLGLAIAAAMMLESASLTLALAAQLLSLSWIIRRFELPGLGWLLKVIVTLVVTRLTLNPWLPDYPADVHWSLWTYGGSTLFAAASALMLKQHASLSRWVAGAAGHLLVLTLWAELRYQLYDGQVFAAEYSFTEAVCSTALFGALAAIYSYRARLSRSLETFFNIYASVLLTVSMGLYLWILVRTLNSDSWIYLDIGDTPIWNLATLAYGLPVIVGLLLVRLFDAKLKRRMALGTGVALMVFVSLSIRHLWTGNVRLDSPSFSDGELYTYSAVWLTMAIAALLGGIWRFGMGVYRAGLALLALVIAKLFLIDLAGLEGLLRVASFMGLGLSLLGVSFLHQRLSAAASRQSDSGAPGG